MVEYLFHHYGFRPACGASIVSHDAGIFVLEVRTGAVYVREPDWSRQELDAVIMCRWRNGGGSGSERADEGGWVRAMRWGWSGWPGSSEPRSRRGKCEIRPCRIRLLFSFIKFNIEIAILWHRI